MADTFESIASIPDSTQNYDQVWCVTDRENGKTIEYLESRLREVSSADDNVFLLEDQIRLDSCVTYNASATIFDGLGHLEGETVGVLADGYVLDQATVTSSSIVTSSAYTKVCVGLPYYSDFETLDIELGLENGTVQGTKIKVGNVMHRFVESRGGWLGPDEDNLYEAFTDLIISRNQSEMVFSPLDYDWTTQNVDNPSPYLYSGDIRRPVGAGWKKGGRTFFRQVDPVPVTITSIVPEIKSGGPV